IEARVSYPMQKTLILWDIDGTLLHSGGAGMKALETALQEVFGVAGSLAEIDFAGRTDRWIIRQIFARFGIEHTPDTFSKYVDGYISLLPEVLGQSRARILPGVAEILAQAAVHPGVVQGLLTGTLRRARGHWGLDFPAERVWIIGDTPHDIACARAFGARAGDVMGRVPDDPDALRGEIEAPVAAGPAQGAREEPLDDARVHRGLGEDFCHAWKDPRAALPEHLRQEGDVAVHVL